MAAENKELTKGNFLSSIDSLSTLCSTSTQVYVSKVPPGRLGEETVVEHPAEICTSGPQAWLCQENNEHTICAGLEVPQEPERAHRNPSCFRGVLLQVMVLASWARKVLRKLVWKIGLLRGEVSEEDADCLVTQVARSNLQALHAFVEACPLERMGTCKNRVCRQKAKLLAYSHRYLSDENYKLFYKDYKRLLRQIQGDGSNLIGRVEDVRKWLVGWPRLDREFQRLVALYYSEHGYLPSKGLDFRNCKYNPPRVSLPPEEMYERSKVLQTKMSRKGLKVGCFEDVVRWISKYGVEHHQPLFTYFYCATSIVLFAFMAGAYPSFLLDTSLKDPEETLKELRNNSSPEDFVGWVSLGHNHSFAFEYLLSWGGRYAPSLRKGEAWRWFSSAFIHQNFQHIIANSVLLIALSGYSEYVHGTWRTLLVFLVSSLGGNFLSACCEDPCILVVGASGAVFGFMGFFIADSIVNFETMSRPWLRLTVIFGLIAFFGFTIFGSQSDSYVSHFSHIGGFVCGLFPSFLIIPNIKQERKTVALQLTNRLGIKVNSHTTPNGLLCWRKREIWEESIWARYRIHPFGCIGIIVLIAFFSVLPLYLYTSRMLSMQCSDYLAEVDIAGVIAWF